MSYLKIDLIKNNYNSNIFNEKLNSIFNTKFSNKLNNKTNKTRKSSKYIKLKFKFNEYSHGKYIRNEIKKLLEKIRLNNKIFNTNLDNKKINRIILVIDELVNNAIAHSNSDINIAKIKIKLNPKKNKLKILVSISDKGNKNGVKAKNISELKEKNNSPENMFNLRGRGLYKIVENIANKTKIIDNTKGGITVKARIIIKLDK